MDETISPAQLGSIRSEEVRRLFEDIGGRTKPVLQKHVLDLLSAYGAGKEVAATFEFKRCLDILVEKIANLLSVEIVSLMLKEKGTDELVMEISRGIENDAAKSAKVKIGDGIAGWIASSGEALLVEDITKDERFSSCGGKYYTNSLLSVPLTVNNEVIGVINVNNKTSKTVFSSDDLDILRIVADLAAVAIENARFRRDAAAREQFKSDFISNVSHELRTPLTAIKEAVGMTLDGITGEVNDDQKRFLRMAQQNIDRLSRLISEMLALAACESRHTVRRQLFDVVEVVKDAALFLKPLAKERMITFLEMLPSSVIGVWADRDKISQVFINLIGNAIKYNREHGRVEVAVEDSGDFVKIVVSDNGIGIPAQDLERIFERFYRVQQRAEHKNREGSGLGLAITKEIIDASGGEIFVSSQVGRGSAFTVALPKDMRKSGHG
ncbi:MAG: GAF domain-containing sensor histidine kinase [Candidatus Omnitrophota bacterium]|nr:GAF domain-containing sensor histidine kinase [Candidatus Omnitrophota bacterium]